MVKRSEAVLLTLMITTVAALNVERQPDTVRNQYKSREDCLRDYSESLCRENYHSTHGYSTGTGRWYGPEYRDDERTRYSRNASGRETTRRGGFGFSGRGASG